MTQYPMWKAPAAMTNRELYLLWALGLSSHSGPQSWKAACMAEWKRRGSPEE